MQIWHWPLAAALLLLSLLLGGGQGTLGDSLCQALSLVLIGIVFWRHRQDPEAALPPAAWLIAGLPLALPLLQLLPVPEFLWLSTPAREALAPQLAAAGVEPAQRLGLVPLATERAALWLLPAVAMFLSTLQFDSEQRRRLLLLFVAIAVLSVVLGIAQLAGGKDSVLRFYTITNPTEAVGFFANRNHLASLLAMALPFTVLGAVRWQQKREGQGATAALGVVAGIGIAALLILGIALARSRAGLLLGMVGLLLSLPLVLSMRRRRGTRRVLAVAIGMGLVLSIQFALLGILQRLEKDPFDDARFKYAGVVVQLAGEHAPLGTGLGGFRRAFEASDTEPGAYYINNAHNDYAQLWLEGGWPALLLITAALLAFAWAGWRAWRKRQTDDERLLASVALRRASWIALLLVLLHSLGDYPLRTTAHLALFGLLVASLFPHIQNSRKVDHVA
ncbi:O-antigen ligase family protein [Arenimonas daejeonensis]|uniref:O-antigen ligase family protein n=1 Tax=Arenimonas daejeonensis TaxID=370777 RepID=UPI00131515CF|nr:O-antigen ligase family protein [Arenimonas daejeonensis]